MQKPPTCVKSYCSQKEKSSIVEIARINMAILPVVSLCLGSISLYVSFRLEKYFFLPTSRIALHDAYVISLVFLAFGITFFMFGVGFLHFDFLHFGFLPDVVIRGLIISKLLTVLILSVLVIFLVTVYMSSFFLIPTCILSLHSKMREKHHGTKSFLVISELMESNTKNVNEII